MVFLNRGSERNAYSKLATWARLLAGLICLAATSLAWQAPAGAAGAPGKAPNQPPRPPQTRQPHLSKLPRRQKTRGDRLQWREAPAAGDSGGQISQKRACRDAMRRLPQGNRRRCRCAQNRYRRAESQLCPVPRGFMGNRQERASDRRKDATGAGGQEYRGL